LNGADYIIITHSDFYTDVQPLADYRAAQGLRTVQVKVEDIYDEFSYGIFDPEAIRNFLAYTYQNWQPPASAYVLLVGDGNYDFLDNFGYGEPNYIPPYLAKVDPNLGEAPADNRYVSVSGSDILPDMNVGRLPVKSRAEVSALVAKILNYEQNPASNSGDWRKRVLFVADNADRAGNFPVISDGIINDHLPEPYQAQRVYYLVTHASPALVKGAIREAINQGVLMVNYNGHSSTENWATERLWVRDDIDSLTNADQLPFVAPMTCLDGYFVTPSSAIRNYSSLGESIVRASGKGAIASWSPAGLGVATGHDFLNRGLFDAIFDDYVSEIGLANMQAKLYLYSHSAGYRDLIETYTLFGDPATTLPILWPELGIRKSGEMQGLLEVGDMVTYTLVYSNSGERWTSAVISDTLPGGLGNASLTYSGVTPVLRAGTQFVWDIPHLEAGQGGTVTITAQVVGDIGGGLFNHALVYGLGDSLLVGNNQAEDYYQVIKLPLVFR
jgi:uncharacterized repeat protein (TIGR01451 family)